MEICAIGIFDIESESKPWLAFKESITSTRSMDSRGDISEAQLQRYQANQIFGTNYIFKKDYFGLAYLILLFETSENPSETVFAEICDLMSNEIISRGELGDAPLVCKWWHYVIKAETSVDDSVYVGSKDIEFGSTIIRPGYCFTKVKNWPVNEDRLIDGILCAEREWIFIDKDNKRLSKMLARESAVLAEQDGVALDDMRDQLIRNILLDEQVLCLAPLSIQIYHELQASWSIPDLSIRLEARSHEVYEIMQQMNLEVESNRSQSRNRTLLVISLLTVLQVFSTLWGFTFDRLKHDHVLSGPGLAVSIVSAVFCTLLLGTIIWKFLTRPRGKRRTK